MSAIRSLGLAALASAAVVVGGCSNAPEPTPREVPPPPSQAPVNAERAPNFVVVLTDDQDPASIEAMPKLQRGLAARGVTFENAFASSPECCPSRASLLTGQYVHNHGVLTNDPPDGGFGSFADANALPVWLEDSGYRTGYVGKYLNNYGWDALGNDPAYVPPGWTEWAALTNHTEYGLYGFDLNVNGEIVTYGEEPADYQTDVLADRADEFVRESVAGDQPFYLTVGTVAPHDEGALEEQDVPRNPRPAPRHEGRYEDVSLPRGPAFNERDVADKPRFVKNDPQLSAAEIAQLERLYRSRLESLLAVDDLVAELTATLRRAGELDETVLMFTSDNGFLLGEHRQRGKEKVYEESAGVPLVIAGPGFARGVVEEHPVSNVDLVATIVEQAGVKAGLELDGVSLARPGAIASRPPLLIELAAAREFAAIRTLRWVYAEYEQGGTELYDLRRDPAQLENLRKSRAHRSVGERLSARLAELRDCRGASCRSPAASGA